MKYRNKTIGQKIKIFSQQRKITQTELGKCVDLDRDAISRMERNKQLVKADVLFGIAGTLGINIYDFGKL